MIRLGAIGDVVRTLPAAAGLRASWPRAHLAWLVEPAAASVLRGQPWLDEVIVFPRDALGAALRRGRLVTLAREARAFTRELRGGRFDLVVDFHAILKSGLLAWLSGAKRRVSYARPFAREGAGWFATDRARARAAEAEPLRSQRGAAALPGERGRAAGAPAPRAARPRSSASTRRSAPVRAPVVIHPGTSDATPYKRWTAAGYASVARALAADGVPCRGDLGPRRERPRDGGGRARRGGCGGAPGARHADARSTSLRCSRARVSTSAPTAARCTWPRWWARRWCSCSGPPIPVENAPYPGTPSRTVRVQVGCNPCRRGCAAATCMRVIPPAAVLAGGARASGGPEPPVGRLRRLMSALEILVRGPNWTGDLVMATPGFRALRAGFPDARITLHVQAKLAPLLAGAPWFDAVAPFARPGAPLREGRALRALARFDLGLCLPDSFEAALLMRAAGVKRIVGYPRNGRGPLLHQRVPFPSEAGRRGLIPRELHVLGLVEALGCTRQGTALELFVTEAEQREADTALAAGGVAAGEPVALIAPGASFGASKLWPAEAFAAVGDALVRAGARVVLTGTEAERALATRVRAAMRRGALDLCGALGLGAWKGLMRRARLLVANDAGARHVATALGATRRARDGSHLAREDELEPRTRERAVGRRGLPAVLSARVPDRPPLHDARRPRARRRRGRARVGGAGALRGRAAERGEARSVKVLVTGGAGFIGSHLVDALVAAGHRVRVLDASTRRCTAPGAGARPAHLPPAGRAAGGRRPRPRRPWRARSTASRWSSTRRRRSASASRCTRSSATSR